MYKSDKWWVSPYNFTEEVRRQFRFPEKIIFHDVTLRDGEQMAGVVFNTDEKILIAKLLDEIGVDRIEAGNPAISELERKSIKAVANLGLNAKIFSLARSIKSDIDLALSCDVSGILLYSPGSELQIKQKFGWTIERAIEVPIEAALYAKSHGLYVAYTPYDTTRSDISLLKSIIQKVVEEGKVDSIAIFDTVGCINPQAMFHLVSKIREFCKVPLEVHCHNDFGLAVANTLVAVVAGVEVVHTSVNGIGERCGNAALEEVALGLKLLYGLDVKLKFEKFYELSRIVEERSGVKVSVNKPIVGINAFRFEAGLVVDGIIKYPLTLEPILPELVGQKHSVLLGKKSGKASIQFKLKELGITATDEEINKILEKVKREGEEKKRPLTDDEFKNIVKEIIFHEKSNFS
jgi:methanogen homocitrate synthase